MEARLLAASLLAIALGQSAAAEEKQRPGSGEACERTEPVPAEPPADPHASSFGRGPWYINGTRTLWADPWDPWTTSPRGIKVLWIRPAGQQLLVTGRRLDGAAPPLKVHIPCCYPWTYQSTRLTFPATGCWEIAATAGTDTLTFVVGVDSPAVAREGSH